MKIHKGKKDGHDYYFIQQGTSLYMQKRHQREPTDDPLHDWEEMIVDLCEHSIEKQDQALKIIKKLRKENREKQSRDEPYFGWCNVEGCKNEGCSGGMAWRETGYWTVCSDHSQMHRNGESQPKMNQKAIEKEKSRDKKTGYLP
ncbi:hypothetical protein LCGC14_1228000 [marine sediment metagenome]|uniref:Uncharacterized protein n=1 Tax=marine sediment metagenome TaxID=412755 RepID=A0A0F9LWL0_9ZZZZ|nr:hypothetical protein [Candidatus Scalindua sp.]